MTDSPSLQTAVLGAVKHFRILGLRSLVGPAAGISTLMSTVLLTTVITHQHTVLFSQSSVAAYVT